MNEWDRIIWSYTDSETKGIAENHVPVSLRPPEILHGLL
jgi:hypothetical protein